MGKRKGIDVSDMDHKALKKAFVDLDPAHAGLLRVHMSGAHYTNDARCKYLLDVDRMCPLCGQPDGVMQNPSVPAAGDNKKGMFH